MLSINNLTKIYTSKKGVAVAALSNVSVDFGDRGLVFLLGKSGSGKTTMLNLLGGLDAPTSGELMINGRSSESFGESDYDSYRNTYVGFVFQEFNLLDEYSVGVNIGLALELQGKRAERADVDEYLVKVGLVDKHGSTLYGRRVNELSGGQRQRVAIARALVKDPQIILADEPTGSLDKKTGRNLYELLKELAKDKLVIVVSHDAESAEKYGDRIIHLKDGMVLSDTAPAPQTGEQKANECKFIKSRLPAKRIFMMGFSTLLGKKFRLVLSLLLCVITFTAFGFALTASTIDELNTELQTAYDNGCEFVTLSGYSRMDNGKFANEIPFTDRQRAVLNNFDAEVEPINVFSFDYTRNGREMVITLSYYLGGYGYTNLTGLGNSALEFFAELDPLTGAADAGLTPDKRFKTPGLCRLPQSYDEIAITDLAADMLINYGYVEYDRNVDWNERITTPINSPDELIGKKFNNFTICGVYSTQVDLDELKKIDTSSDYDNDYKYSRINGAMGSIITYGFVRKGFLDNYKKTIEPTRALIRLPSDIGKTRALIDSLTHKVGSKTYTTVRLNSEYSGFIERASYTFNEYFIMVAVILVIVFAIFAVIISSNFLSASLHFKRRELGILRALGARKRDVALICLAESLLKAGIEFAVSVAALVGICIAANFALHVSALIIGLMPVSMMLLLTFGVSAIGTLFPIRRLSKKRPVDIINNK